MNTQSLEMTSKILATIIKQPKSCLNDIISSLSIAKHDKRVKTHLAFAKTSLEECKSIKASGPTNNRVYEAKNPDSIPNGNLLVTIYNSIESKALSSSYSTQDVAKIIIINVYEAGEQGITAADLRDSVKLIEDDEFEEALSLALQIKSITIKEDDGVYTFSGSPMYLILNVNDELNILTGDIDELEETFVKKIDYSKMPEEDKNTVWAAILGMIPEDQDSTISRNFIARNNSRTPQVKYLGRQVIIDLIETMKDLDLVDIVDSKSGKREFLFLTEKGKKKLSELS
ncbi:hypothetical protein [Psychromonas sp. SP041]|uniref:hypothetical protein n=1 Tax=Psychromonas sp. SP041 TaxID=1365007 RepID=UPI0010C77923|nr:hypothetical protein [Psychromonas sp. SP041]